MLNLLGEHNCKIDAKGRLMFPARLRRQLESVIHHGLVINRDIFERVRAAVLSFGIHLFEG